MDKANGNVGFFLQKLTEITELLDILRFLIKIKHHSK